jgi:hypothetical protein
VKICIDWFVFLSGHDFLDATVYCDVSVKKFAALITPCAGGPAFTQAPIKGVALAFDQATQFAGENIQFLTGLEG